MSQERSPRSRKGVGGLLCSAALLAGCGAGPTLDCAPGGVATGEFSDPNYGVIDPRHGVAWRLAEGGRVVITDSPDLARVLLASPDPEFELDGVRGLLGVPVTGFEADSGGRLVRYFTRVGMPSGGGSGGGARGSMAIDAEGCVRGDYWLYRTKHARFAVPLVDIETNRRAQLQDIEAGEGAPSPEVEAAQDTPPWSGRGGLEAWARLHARLSDPSPAEGFRALGFSESVALELAQSDAARRTLRRLAEQCPHPRYASLDEYGDVTGRAEPAEGVWLQASAVIRPADSPPPQLLCYSMGRNGEPTEQCFTLYEDCAAPAASGN